MATASLVVATFPTAPPSPHTEVTVTAPDNGAFYTLLRVDHGTGERVMVRSANKAAIATATVVPDFECQLNRDFHYEATFYTTALAVVGAVISSATVNVADGGVCSGWLSAPGIPSLAMSIEPVTDAKATRPVERDILYVMGRRRAIVVSGTRHDREQTWRFITRSVEEKELFLQIIYNANPVLLRLVYPVALANGGYLSVLDVDEERYDETDPLNPLRWWEFETVSVDVPDDGYGLAYHNWGELKATAPTWQYTKDHWRTWLEVLRDPSVPTVP